MAEGIRSGSGDTPLTLLTDDSNQVTPGACYVAVKGGRHDGLDFVPAALAAGAAAVVTDRPVRVSRGVAAVLVPDVRSALSRLAAAYYLLRPGQARSTLGLIGVTGTNGKSTTCELLRSIVQAAGQRAALLGTIRYDLVDEQLPANLTTPPALELCRLLARAADRGAHWAIMEASSHALDQRRCDGLTFAAAVFTNLTGDHLDYHGNTDEYLRAKKRLFDQLDPDAVAVVNAEDDSSNPIVADCRARLIRYGLDGGLTDLTATIESLRADGSTFKIVGLGCDVRVRCPLVGRHNVMNALAAAATARALGFEDDIIRRGIEAVGDVRGRLERVDVPGREFAVLVDYAHTDDALRRVLSALRPLTRGRLICVFGCGGDRDRTKRPRMAAAVAELADLAVVTSDNPRTEDPDRIIREVLAGFAPDQTCRIEVEPDRRRAIDGAIGQAGPGDTVLIAGKGHEDYQIVGHTRRHFDDVEEARTCLARRFGVIGVAS